MPKLEAQLGDITKLSVDAIVNAVREVDGLLSTSRVIQTVLLVAFDPGVPSVLQDAIASAADR
ncbi:hypothetical protein [Botrimarina sp.]|uniref:hypothetical protein n=1 Tax=Botrimarina sp. TaxID=2795802 RepID=UPI0032ECE0BE